MFLLTTIMLLRLLHVEADDVGCLSRGNNVDWFVVYKLPGYEDRSLDFDSTAADNFRVGTLTDAADTSPLKATIDDFLAKRDPDDPQEAAVAYNDFPPYFQTPVPGSAGRGILLMSTGLGSWIVHTFPQFGHFGETEIAAYKPDYKAGLALCLTMDTRMEDIFVILTYANAVMYDRKHGNVPAFMDQKAQAYMRGDMLYMSPFVKAQTFATVDAKDIMAVAKFGAVHADIHSAYVARALKQSMRVRFDDTTKATDVLANKCTLPYSTENVGGYVTVEGTGVQASSDGGVWSVSKTGNTFCVSSIPRRASTMSLSSAVVCVKIDEIYRTFNAIAETSNSVRCP